MCIAKAVAAGAADNKALGDEAIAAGVEFCRQYLDAFMLALLVSRKATH